MCRSIRDLRRQPDAPTPDEIEAAARQFIRKVSGYRAPPRRHAAAYEAAIAAVASTTTDLLATLLPQGDAGQTASSSESTG